MTAFAPAAVPPQLRPISEPVFAPPPSIEPAPVAEPLVDPWAAPAEPDWAQPTDMEPLTPQLAQAAPVATSAGAVAAPAQEHNDLWFLSTEPQETTEPSHDGAATAAAKPHSAVQMALVTIGLAVAAVVLVLIFIQFMTGILR
jgi:hypothetical protein